jgi:PAS domain S-box-containing protein
MESEAADEDPSGVADPVLPSIDDLPLAAVVTDPRLPDNPIIAINAAFTQLTGYTAEESIGRNCRFLAGAATDSIARAELRAAVAAGRPALVELVNYRKDGSQFRNAVMIAPVKDDQGQIAYFQSSQMEVVEKPSVPLHLRQSRAPELVAKLTPRQRQVLGFMIQGYRNKQIAALIGIDEKTVKMHRAAMLGKLAAGTSSEAVRIGVEAGLAD